MVGGGGERKTNETKNCFLEKINKIGKTSARLTKEKKTEDPNDYNKKLKKEYHYQSIKIKRVMHEQYKLMSTMRSFRKDAQILERQITKTDSRRNRKSK